MCVKVYTSIGEHGIIGGTYRIHFQRQDGCVWFSSWHMHLWLQSGGNKKKRQRIRKHVKSISYINENWILILNYSISNKLAVYVYDKKEGCVVLISFSLNLLTLAKKARIFMPSDLCLYTCKLFRDLVCWMVTLTEVLYLRCFKKSDF